MTPELLSILHECYIESGRDKDVFFELAYKRSGLKKQAFERGALFDFVNTAVWINKGETNV